MLDDLHAVPFIEVLAELGPLEEPIGGYLFHGVMRANSAISASIAA